MNPGKRRGFLRLIARIVSIIMLTCLLMPLCLRADGGGEKKVRAGWYYSRNFSEGRSDAEPKSGFCYEYMQKVADYNNWEYEYVYGNWADLFEKLKNGEIDILGGVTETPEREGQMLFPNSPMGTERYYVYQRDDNRVMDENDISSFDGKRIGAVNNSLMTDYLVQWREENNANFEIVFYVNFDARDAALMSGEVDGVVATNNNISFESGIVPVVQVGEEPYSLAVSATRPDLLDDLNYSLSIIQEVDPYFIQDLQYRSYGEAITSTTLTSIEEEWINSHSVINVGYFDNYMPYSSRDENGNPTGLVSVIIESILNELNLTDRLSCNYICYESYDDMLLALNAGEIDLAFPVGGDAWNLEQAGVKVTNTVVAAGMDLVYRRDRENENYQYIAINRNNRLQYYYAKSCFPTCHVVWCGSMEECLNAVKNGSADATIVNGLRSDIARNNSDYNDLSVVQLEKVDNRYIGVSDGSSGLLLLMSRGLKLLGNDYGYATAMNYLDVFYSYTAIDFLRDNIIKISVVLMIIIALVMSVIIWDARKSKEQARVKNLLNDKLEGALREASEASQAKTTFLFNMSHDIRTPLNAIIGYTSLLENSHGDREKSAEYIRKIKESGNILLSLVNNVLELSRIESGKETLEESVLDMFKFKDQMISVFEELLSSKDISFSTKSDVQHNLIYADELKIREIFLNILSNAYKYTPDHGCISISVVELPANKKGYVRFKTMVTDTGRGISHEFLPHIFDDFSREQNSTDSKVPGTGLGMRIVKKYVDLMGGTIHVESDLGVGTSVIVYLEHRIADEEALISTESASEAAVDISLKGKRILLAEDNDLNAEIAVTILNDNGVEVDRVTNGRECIVKLMEKDADYYDLILMDIQMPVLDGLSATKSIRKIQDPKRASIPIIAMTANAFEEDRRNSIAVGMNGHLAKPININEMLSVIGETLKK